MIPVPHPHHAAYSATVTPYPTRNRRRCLDSWRVSDGGLEGLEWRNASFFNDMDRSDSFSARIHHKFLRKLRFKQNHYLARKKPSKLYNSLFSIEKTLQLTLQQLSKLSNPIRRQFVFFEGNENRLLLSIWSFDKGATWRSLRVWRDCASRDASPRVKGPYEVSDRLRAGATPKTCQTFYLKYWVVGVVAVVGGGCHG